MIILKYEFKFIVKLTKFLNKVIKKKLSKFNRFFINFIAKSNLLQLLASKFILYIPITVSHNLEKYSIIKKIIYIISIDEIEGDYAEFGCFTGSCLKHVHRCLTKFNLDKNIFGFDSFQGFPKELHKEFKSEFFKVDYEKIITLENKYSKIKFFDGFFSTSLKNKSVLEKVKDISFSFIDCDLATSAKDVFEFIVTRQTNGSSIMIDDFYNLDIEGNSIRKEFFKYFKLNEDVFLFKNFGIGGVCFRYFKK